MDHLIQETLEANLDLQRHQLVVFTWGNASTIDRERGLIIIKPSGVPYDRLEARHMVAVDFNSGKVLSGTYRPSSDTATHLEIYRQFPQVQGIVHTHSRWATLWAQACLDLIPYGTTHADYFRGSVPCTRSLTDSEIAGDYELNTGKVIVETFCSRQLDPLAIPGALVAGHGPFTWGASAMAAVQNAVVLEECAMMAFHSRMLRPELPPISEALLQKHYQRKHGKSAYYGQK